MRSAPGLRGQSPDRGLPTPGVARGRGLRHFALLLTLAAAVAPPIAAQFSPGPLSRSHAALEGSRRCLDCHSSGRAVDGAACLRCHGALRARVEAGRGLHAAPEYRRCEVCHAEHNGADFELVFWGEAGRGAFDHRAAGLPLVGAHAELACDQCHRKERLPKELLEPRAGVAPATTFLGLGAACVDCHADPHRGSLAPAQCTSCHGSSEWTPARGFDHAATRFPLTGAHLAADCLACHRQEAAPGTAPGLVLSQFRDTPRPACARCHDDPHAGRLGADCAGCHSTGAFRPANRSRFDHDRTAYPLAGAHRAVACAECHPGGGRLRIAGFARCETCHQDAHVGQLAPEGATAPPCSTCHTVGGFRPAAFSLEDHARTWPLGGAHRAVSCAACHPVVPPAQLRPPFQRRARRPTTRLRYGPVGCRDCHDDPHRGALDRYVEGAACSGCHRDDSWTAVSFDHDRSRYPLRGKHRQLACAACHTPAADRPLEPATATRTDPPPAPVGLQLTDLARDCAGCHADPHAGQLQRDGATRCERCHTEDTFRPARFDHQRDSRYPLDGAHQRVPCAGCHLTEVAAPSRTWVRYKPLPTHCEGCHAKPPSEGQGGRR